MAENMKGRYWTETYHSWEEYAAKHPDYDKSISTRIAAMWAKQKIEENGVYVAQCFTPVLDKRAKEVQRAVSKFLRGVEKADKASRNSKLIFCEGLEAVV